MNTSAQESLFQQNLCSRWRERRETYEMHQDDQDDVHSLFNETDVPKNPTKGMFKEVHLEQVETSVQYNITRIIVINFYASSPSCYASSPSCCFSSH